jgi:hypothetical protein
MKQPKTLLLYPSHARWYLNNLEVYENPWTSEIEDKYIRDIHYHMAHVMYDKPIEVKVLGTSWAADNTFRIQHPNGSSYYVETKDGKTVR